MLRQDQDRRLWRTYLTASCDPSLGKHGGATTLAQFSRISALKIGEKYATFNIVAVNGLK
jgi:hypothetical protein